MPVLTEEVPIPTDKVSIPTDEVLIPTDEVPILTDKVPIGEELSNQSQDKQQDSQEVRQSGRQSHPILHYNNQFIVDMRRDDFSMAFLSQKEEADLELSLKLRKKGVITTPGAPFEASQQQEIDGLIA
jgi:hypothetical protein